MKTLIKILKYLLVLLLIVSMYIVWYIHSGLQYAAPHFHANFAMYINGERIDFSADRYSQDVAWCKIGDTIYAKDRVHLHENNPDTIHIHHDWVTWGDFFANNNMIFNGNVLILDDGKMYSNNEKDTLRFLLNGEAIANPFNILIESQDRLLINFWEESIDQLSLWKYLEVSDNAEEYNNKYDPWTCSWTNENSKMSLMKDLLHRLMWH